MRLVRFRIAWFGGHLCEWMSSPADVEQLRTRAGHLRAVASRIGASRALVIYALAGPETWVGPTPQACDDALLAIRRRLLAQQQALNDTARTFDRRADELEQRSSIPELVS